MINNQNLKPIRSSEEARERGRKGGIASGKSRKEKKTIQTILNDLLETSAKDNAQFAELATRLGVDSKKSVKDIITMVYLLNSIKSGDLSDLEKIVRLLGENPQMPNAEKESQTQLLDAIEKAVRDAD